MKFWIIFIVLSINFDGFLGDEQSHSYEEYEDVHLWMHSVWPYTNKIDKNEYFTLPFCMGPKLRPVGHRKKIEGFNLEFSGLSIEFKYDLPPTVYCEIELDQDKLKAFKHAVKNDYRYKMFMDGLHIFGIVGEMDELANEYYIYSHKKFEIGYNGNQIVEVNMTNESKTLLQIGSRIPFSYEVNWKSLDLKFEDRLQFQESKSSQNHINWITISFVMAYFLGYFSNI